MTRKGIWTIFLLYFLVMMVLAFGDFGPDFNDTLYIYGLKTYRLEEVPPNPNAESFFYREGGWVLRGYRANYRTVTILITLGAVTAYLSSKRRLELE